MTIFTSGTITALCGREQKQPEQAAEQQGGVVCEEFAAVFGVEVGITDNFFNQNGDSLMATEVAACLSRRLNTSVSVKDIFNQPVVVDLAAAIHRGSTPHSPTAGTTYSSPVEQSFALSRLWFLDQLNVGSTWYNMPLATRMRGPLQVDALAAALLALEQRHETLRTTFEERDGVGMQVIHPSGTKDLRVVDVSAEQDGDYRGLLKQEQTAPFDLASEPGWRVSLLRLGEDDHVLSIVMHHIISDGWSVNILRQELGQFYAAALRGRDPLSLVSPLPIQYRDFSIWQKQPEQAVEHQRQLEYWKMQLADSSPAELLSDRPRPSILSGRAGVIELAVEGLVYERLEAFCRSNQTTSFIVLLAAFRAAHYRLTGAEDATIGTPIANRNRPELENMIGFFVNTQCMRIAVGDDDTFEGLVRQVRFTTTAAFANQDVPFERIVSALMPGSRDTSRNPLVQLAFMLHPQRDLGKIQLEDLSGEAVPGAVTTRFDAEFHLFQMAGSLGGTVLYSTDLFEPKTIHSVVAVFQEVLRRGLERPQMPISALPLTDGLAELRSIGLLDIERTDYPRESSVVDVFRKQVAATPHATAVTDSSSRLTYAQLDGKSDKLAAWLRRRGMTAETLVGVLAPRSCQTVVAFFGILKANLAYVPLDVNLPGARIGMILSAVAGHKLVLLGHDVAAPDISLADVELVQIGDTLRHYGPDDPTAAAAAAAAAVDRPSATNLAYVMFTSGSTGRPKGVMVEHRGIVRLVTKTNLSATQAAVPVAHITNIGFDVSTWEIYAPLLNGGTVVCIDYITVLDPTALAHTFSREMIRTAFFTPAFLKQCLVESTTAIGELESLFVGGDRLDPRDAVAACEIARCDVINAYGPTENTTYSTLYRVQAEESCINGVPIGRAVSNSGAYIMDRRQQLVPLGVMGELVVTGDGLARGYTDPALDRDRFVQVQINGESVRAYRTGDRARYRPKDGQIEFFGRIDQQIKIRGHRIEPAEVEHAILKHEAVRDAAVVVRVQEGQEPEMVGFVAVRADGSAEQDRLRDEAAKRLGRREEQFAARAESEIRGRLRTLLPSYMVPGRIMVLDQMPLNANGKVDRKELARMAQIAPKSKIVLSVRVAPRNEVEAVLCEEFAAVFGVEIGITDNFFDQGGHSLMATKLAARLSRRLDICISVKDIFDQPVLGDFAAILRRNSTPHIPISGTAYSGPVEQSFAQGRLWFLDQFNVGSTWYIMPLATRMRGPLQVDALAAALLALEQRHETLRTTFEEKDGVGMQIIHPSGTKDLRVVDVSAEQDGDYRGLLKQEQTAPFDLASEPGWRVSLLRLGEDDHVLSIVMHHIISDGWSVDILRQELGQFYAAALRGRDPLSLVSPLPIQYRDFSIWQKQPEQAVEHQRQLEYWKTQLADSSPAELLSDRPRPSILSGRAGVVELAVEGSLYERLQAFCRTNQVTPFTVLLAAFRAAHYRLTGAEDATIGTPIANRNRPELENMIGFFVNTQCMRIAVGDDDTLEGLVRQVRFTATTAFANQDVPFERIVSALVTGSRDTSRNPLVQLVFALHSQRDFGKIQLEGLSGEHISEAVTTRFDVEFHLFQMAGSLDGTVLYSTDLFEPKTIHGVVAVFQEVLRRGLERPQMPISALPLTDGLAELRSIGLLDIERTDYPHESSVVDVFREQVAATPHATAVTDSSSRLTYAQLDGKSDKLATWLCRRGMAAETLVGVLAPRSCQTVVAFLGILKANLAYIPLDVNLPGARIGTVLSAVAGHKLVLLGHDVAAPAAAVNRPSATNLAYVMFTSGSTGRPKGVMVEHRGIVRLVTKTNIISATQAAVPVAHIANPAFDMATWEIYTALLNGGTVVCIDYMTVLDPTALAHTFSKEMVQVAVFTPAFLKQYVYEIPYVFSQLDLLLTGGDNIRPQDALEAAQLVRHAFYNAYGPTENTGISTIYRIQASESFVNGVPIGRTFSNSGAYIMDRRQQLVPLGVMGELVVTGDGLARGYTDPALDRDRFVQVQINGESVRAYRTGDRARYRPKDGQIEFFGRMDQQIKIRGHRIEPAEVEHAMLGHEAVRDAAVVVRAQDGQEPEMVGFVAVRADGSAEQDEASNQVEGWANHFETAMYADINTIRSSAVGSDFVGWTSMYDGSAIDRAEMQEWLDDTMQTLLDGQAPGCVLEIGTGTGMILFNLGRAAGLESYVGLEPSRSAASFVADSVKSVPALAGRVEVHVGTATDAGQLDGLGPDLVVLNSVVQYFPTPEYLIEVVDALARMPGVKRLFFGDIRSHAINRDFLAARALHSLGGSATKAGIRRKMAEMEDREEELLVDPAFFTSLASQLPNRVKHIEILPKRMRSTNELSSYRYAAVVHIGGSEEQGRPVHAVDADAWIDFAASRMDHHDLLSLLQRSPNAAAIAVGNIPYSKTIVERHIIESLDDDDDKDKAQDSPDGPAWVSAVRSGAERRASLSAADLAQLAEEAGFRVEISWARQRSQNGALDAVFHHYPPAAEGARVLFQFPTDDEGAPLASLTNRPLRRLQSRRVEGQIYERLQAQLPSYMVPQRIMVLDRMPLNANGKVDRKGLARMAQTIPKSEIVSSVRVAPRNEVEAVVCAEFAAVLGVEVGITDNFFDQGGHSLMATKLAARLSRRLDTCISVKDIFDQPILGDLAAILRRNSTGHIPISGTAYSGLVEQSFAQGQLLFLDRMWNTNPDLIGEPDPGTLEAARTPLILIHDGGGTTFSYYCLHQGLGRPVYGLSNPHFHTGDHWAGGLPEMARHYVGLLRATIGTGNIILGGWSLGGMVALEMAHSLAGDRRLRVVGIVMIDSACPLVWRALQHPLAADIPRNETSKKAVNHSGGRDISHDHQSDSDRDRGSAALDAAVPLDDIAAHVFSETTKQEIKDRIIRCFAETSAMVSNWTLPRWGDDDNKSPLSPGGDRAAAACSLPPPAILLRSQESFPVEAQGTAYVNLAREDPRLGWDLHWPGLVCQVVDIPGHHFNLFAEQNIPEIKKALSLFFDWIVYHHGPATPISDMAGEMWLILIQLAGKLKRADEAVRKIMTKENREMVEEFIEAGGRLTENLREILEACEALMLRSCAKARKNSQLGKNAGVKFVEALLVISASWRRRSV
ncbi:hypothetical protein B0H66DRAFT_630727 [Apodospora peruviana]|uniref:Carrier domain-containing protein n=1 Tax=Apodospora peruviana TaxID=516989 RepID=A0AAE0M020_9PEZI|nr:hypothetical protein B0H66DRAFT_630727 [Apodospora peruviana]